MTTAPDQIAGIALGVVCPMANEAESAVAFVEEVLAACESQGFKSVDFFVVLDRASKDHTLELLQQIARTRSALHVVWAPENRNVVDAYIRGYGEALSAGCDWILEIDAGYSHQPSDLQKFFTKIPEGYPCVFGSRFIAGGSMTESTMKRRVISKGGTVLANALLGTKLTDMTSGYEMFSRTVLKSVLARGIHSQGPFFQTEIKAYCRGLRAAEVPIHYRAPSHNINNASLKDAYVNLWRLFRLRIAGRL
jgi:dolichol-phosphate mannosyltransferase